MTQMINQKDRQALITNNKALTLIEILVSSVILALLMAGLVSLFVAGKRHIVHTRSRMAGGELGKLFLDPLQMDVREDSWAAAGNALQATTPGPPRNCPPQPPPFQPGCPPPADRTLGGILYNPQYTIDRDQPIANVNRVRVTVNWNEPTP